MLMLHDPPVISGCGAIGSFGGGRENLWSALLEEKPLYTVCERFEPKERCAHVGDFNLNNYKRTAKGLRAPRVSQYALAAAAQAVTQSKLNSRKIDRNAVSIVYGTGLGPNAVVETNLAAIMRGGLGAVEPLSFQESVFNAPASRIAIEYGFRGPLVALPMGLAAGGYAITVAADLINFGHADIVLIVVADEMSSFVRKAMRALRLMSKDSEATHIVRPFDLKRSGASDGEGAAALVLERASVASKRGVTPLAELVGWGVASDRSGCGPKHDGAALSQAMREAMRMAGTQRIGLILSGSSCTKDADYAEADAIARTFGDPAFQPPITNIRGTIGESKSATGLFNVMTAISALETGTIPATVGCQCPDPACSVNLVHSKGRLRQDADVMINAFWVNGTNCSIILRRPRTAEERGAE